WPGVPVAAPRNTSSPDSPGVSGGMGCRAGGRRLTRMPAPSCCLPRPSRRSQAISRPPVHRRVDGIRNKLDSSITVQHVAPRLISTLEPIMFLHASPVTHRRARCDPIYTMVHSDVHRLIITLIILGIVAGRVEVFLAEHVGVTGPVRDAGNPDLTALKDNTME